MKKYLLDTNVISELNKKNPNAKIIEWFESKNEEQLFLSCIIIGEIIYGAEKMDKKDKAQAKKIFQWVEKVKKNFLDRILPLDLGSCEEWGKLMAIDSTNPIDALLAAQAKTHNHILVTRNVKHVNKFAIQVESPF